MLILSAISQELLEQQESDESVELVEMVEYWAVEVQMVPMGMA